MVKSTCVTFAAYQSARWKCHRYEVDGSHSYGHYFYTSEIAYHTIDGVEGVLNPAAAIGPDAALPFYLLSHRTLCRDVPAGKLITLGDLDMPEESTLLRLRREQDRAFGLVK